MAQGRVEGPPARPSALSRGGALALALATVFVVLHLRVTATTIRTEEDFTVIEIMGRDAARWLATLDRVARPNIREVVVPRTPHTARLFGIAHRMFLCAPHAMRTVVNVDSEPSAPDRLVLARSSGPVPPAANGWRAIRRACAVR